VAGGRLTALIVEAGNKGKAAKTSFVDVRCKTDYKSQKKSNNPVAIKADT